MGKVIASRKEPDVVFIRVFLRGSVAEFRGYNFKIFASLREECVFRGERYIETGNWRPEGIEVISHDHGLLP